MAQLFFSGCCSSWHTQQSSSALVDRNRHVVIVGKKTDQNFRTAAVAIKSTGDLRSWQRAYPGEFHTCFEDVVQLRDGSYMAVGSYAHSPSARDRQTWLVNISPTGEPVWEKRLGPASGYQSGKAIASTADGGFVLVSCISMRDKQVSTRIMKFTRDKSPAWEVRRDGIECFSIGPALAGGFILSGRKRNGEFAFQPVALVLNQEGKVELDKIFTRFSIQVLPKSDAIQTASGDYVMVANNHIVKFTTAGALLWSRKINRACFNSLVELDDSQLAMGGSILVDYSTQAYVAVTDCGGSNLIWDNCELETPSTFTRVFRDPRFDDGVWVSGHAPLERERSEIVYALFMPVDSLDAGYP